MKIKFLIFTCLLLLNISYVHASNSDLDETVQKITQQLTKEINASGESIAIPPFLTFDNKTTALGKLLSEKLISKFSESKIITPVERDYIFKLIDEMKLGMTGLIEPKTVQQVGKFSGASYVLVGTIQKVGKDIQINSRLVRTETSKVDKSIESILKGTPNNLELLSQEIKTPLMPAPEQTEQQKLTKIDFEKIRKDYLKLQDELENLKQQMARAKDEKSKSEIQNKEKQTQKTLSASEYYMKGSIAHVHEDYNSAIDNFSKAIELDPEDFLAYHGRGQSYHSVSDNTRAIADYSKAIDLYPEFDVAYEDRGDIYSQPKNLNLTKALSDYSKAIEINNNRDTSEMLPESVGFMKSQISMDYSHRGDIYSALGDNVRALADYNRAIELNPKYTKAYNDRGVAYYKNGQISAAKKDFQKACDLGYDKACDFLDKLQR